MSHLPTPSPLPTPCDHRRAAPGGHQPPAFDPLSRPCPFPAIGSVTRKTPCGAALVDLVGLPKISGGGGPSLIFSGVGGQQRSMGFGRGSAGGGAGRRRRFLRSIYGLAYDRWPSPNLDAFSFH
jgi:hypothetical protein